MKEPQITATIPNVFVLNAEDSIIAFLSESDARCAMADGDSLFNNVETLDHITTDWPGARLVAIWNSLPGVVAIKKFKDRHTALTRIWNFIQGLEPIRPEQNDAPSPESGTRNLRTETKKAMLLAMLHRSEGASVREMMAALGWQAHSVRGCLSTLSRQVTGLHSERRADGERAYSISPSPEHKTEAAQ